MNDQDQLVLGIDISKRHFDATLLLRNGKQRNRKFANVQSGFEEFQRWLTTNGVKRELLDQD